MMLNRSVQQEWTQQSLPLIRASNDSTLTREMGLLTIVALKGATWGEEGSSGSSGHRFPYKNLET